MQIFKKIVKILFLIFIVLFSVYYALFDFAKLTVNTKVKFNDFKIIIDATKHFGLKKALFYPIFDGFCYTFVDLFTFKFKTMHHNSILYLTICGFTTFPALITLFKFLTYRGFYAFKLEFKKVIGNPNYYKDFIEENKLTAYDNVKETLPGTYIFLLVFRLLLIIPIIIFMPFILLLFILFEIIGLIKGLTNTGRSTDFD